MFIKPVSASRHLLELFALQRRAPAQSRSKERVMQDYYRMHAGYTGEKSLLFHLKKHPFQQPLMIHDLRIPHEDSFFQMDFVILTRKLAIILEVKYLRGSVLFDYPVFQMIQSYEGEEKSYPDRVYQAQTQKKLLLQHLPRSYPVETLVIMAYPQTVLKFSERYPFTHEILHAAYLPWKLEQFDQTYSHNHLTTKQLESLGKKLLQQHTPKTSNILSTYNLQPQELQKGVHCPKCYVVGMQRGWGVWKCLHCNYQAKDAFVPTLTDYALLHKPTITNAEFCQLTQHYSPSVASKALVKLGIPYEGTTKDRSYTILDPLGRPLFAKNLKEIYPTLY